MTKSLFSRLQAKFLAMLAIGLAAGWVVSASAEIPTNQVNIIPPGLVNYQGTLLTPESLPYTNGIYDIDFRVYPASSGGANTALWGAGYKVFVNNGVFGVMLGQVGGAALNDNPTEFLPAELWKALWFDERAPDNLTLFLGITVKQDQNGNPIASPVEALPRQQFLVTPFAARAQQAMYARRASGDFDVGGNLTITGSATGIGTVPVGGIIMWSGTTNNIPAGWALCNGQTVNELTTPDLRNRFVMGAGGGNSTTGGLASVTLAQSNLPVHTHDYKDAFFIEEWKQSHSSTNNQIPDMQYESTGDVNAGGNEGFDNNNEWIWFRLRTTYESGSASPIAVPTLPPYYALAYIMRVQ